jgi:hypothetical protein
MIEFFKLSVICIQFFSHVNIAAAGLNNAAPGAGNSKKGTVGYFDIAWNLNEMTKLVVLHASLQKNITVRQNVLIFFLALV